MDLIIISITTIIASILMRAKAKLEIYKDISDLGYKFNHERLEELQEETFIECDLVINILNNYSFLIPICNLTEDILREINYYKNRDQIIQKLKDYKAVEEFTLKEKEEYSKRKTGLHAISMERKRMLRLSKASVAEFSNGSIIWFDLNENNNEEKENFIDNIEILKVKGIYKRLSNEALKRKVFDSLIVTGLTMLNEYEDVDSYLNCLPINEEIEFKRTSNPNEYREEDIIEIEIPQNNNTPKIRKRIK